MLGFEPGAAAGASLRRDLRPPAGGAARRCAALRRRWPTASPSRPSCRRARRDGRRGLVLAVGAPRRAGARRARGGGRAHRHHAPEDAAGRTGAAAARPRADVQPVRRGHRLPARRAHRARQPGDGRAHRLCRARADARWTRPSCTQNARDRASTSRRSVRRRCASTAASAASAGCAAATAACAGCRWRCAPVDADDAEAGRHLLLRRRRRAPAARASRWRLQAERTRAILNSVLVGIVTVGDGGIEWMNRSARRMFGGELADFVGEPISIVATPEPDHPLRRTDYLAARWPKARPRPSNAG